MASMTASRMNAGIAEAHLAFGGMDIHVHGGGVHLDEEKGDRVLPLHERGVVALAQGEIERAALDGAAIEKDELLLARRAAERRRGR